MKQMKKWKKYGIIAFAVIAAVLIAVLLFINSRKENKENKENKETAENAENADSADSAGAPALSPLTVTILKVGKADAIILSDESHTMVIDCGEEDDGQEVVGFLQEKGISYIDCLLITHFDKDHVGGADAVTDAMEIGRILLPDYEGTHSEYADFLAALQRNNCTPESLTDSVSFSFGEASVLVEPPLSYDVPDPDKEYDNDFSLITTVTHGENRLLFTGDIEKQRIGEWVGSGAASPCDFLKVPHHGDYNKALESLFDAVEPSYAVITCSDKNPPDEKTLELLKSRGTKTLLTKDGDITVISDGRSLEIRQS